MFKILSLIMKITIVISSIHELLPLTSNYGLGEEKLASFFKTEIESWEFVKYSVLSQLILDCKAVVHHLPFGPCGC